MKQESKIKFLETLTEDVACSQTFLYDVKNNKVREPQTLQRKVLLKIPAEYLSL